MRPEPMLRCICAPNPSPMTYRGTNTYLIGDRDIAVIDPGPQDRTHLAAILAAVGGARVTAILVTHSHLDHSPLARPLADATGAQVLAAGDSGWGRSPLMARLAAEGGLGGGEGVDPDFAPDRQIAEGDRIESSEWQIEVLATPGHMANHLSFAWNGALFSGDLVMGWATSLVSPPDGDMSAFYASLERLKARHDRVYYPGHGDPVSDPAARLRGLYEHRRGREAAILNTLGRAPMSAEELARDIYTDIDAKLIPMATRNVLAHLIDLAERSEIAPEGDICLTSRFSLR